MNAAKFFRWLRLLVLHGFGIANAYNVVAAVMAGHALVAVLCGMVMLMLASRPD